MGVGLSGISAHATGRPGTGGQGVEGCIWRASSVSIWHTEAARPWSSSASQSEGCWGHGSRDAYCPFANLRPAHVRGSPRSLRRLGDECSLGVLRLKVLRVAYKWKDPSRRRCEYMRRILKRGARRARPQFGRTALRRQRAPIGRIIYVQLASRPRWQ